MSGLHGYYSETGTARQCGIVSAYSCKNATGLKIFVALKWGGVTYFHTN